MESTLKTFNFYRSYRLKIMPEDDLDVRLHIIIGEDREICPRGKSEVVDINYNYLSICSEADLKKGDRLSIKLSLKRFLSKWDIYLKGQVVRSFCERKGYVYGIELEDNLELKYFLKEFVSRFSQNRLRKQVLESSIFEKRFNPRQGVEIYSMLIQFVDLFFRSKDKLNITQSLREAARVLQCEEANIYLIRPDTDKLENVVTTSGTLKKERDFREGIIGSVFTNEVTSNLLTKDGQGAPLAVVATPITNKNYHCIGVLEMRNSLQTQRFKDYHEKIIKMLGHIFSAFYNDYTPVSGSCVISNFNPKKREKLAILGRDQVSLDLQKQLKKLKHSSLHLSISGESGTGKSYLARLIHEEGSMRPYPLTVLNFEKDTFFELATLNWNSPGSVILENIHLLKKIHHNHLAQRLQHGLKRVICTSDQSLDALYAQHKISSSLYQLVTQHHVHLPPLRSRHDEIFNIARQLLLLECERRASAEIPEFSPESLHLLEQYDWPKNLQELSLVIKKALMSGDQKIIELKVDAKGPEKNDLISQMLTQVDSSHSAQTIMEDFEFALKNLKLRGDSGEQAA